MRTCQLQRHLATDSCDAQASRRIAARVLGSLGLLVALTIVTSVRAADTKQADTSKERKADEAGIKANADKFAAAFKKGDAKGVAACWTEEGEYTTDEGLLISGRAEIEKSYGEYFGALKVKDARVTIETIHFVSKDAAVEEGIFKITIEGEDEPRVNRYSALDVREGNAWKMAIVRDRAAEPAEAPNPLEQVAFLEGSWTAQGEGVTVKMNYSWLDAEKTFLVNRFTISKESTGSKEGTDSKEGKDAKAGKGDKDSKTKSTGVQILGRDPATGELRGWTFDSDGSVAEATWMWDDNHWLIHVAQTMADGSTVRANNLLIPVSKDAFNWQSARGDGEPPSSVPPMKVTRDKPAR